MVVEFENLAYRRRQTGRRCEVLELAVLADDLTGGMIIAAKLEAAGVVCPLVTDAEHIADLPGDPAAIAQRGARTIYYKYCGLFDSAGRGGGGPGAGARGAAAGAGRARGGPGY